MPADRLPCQHPLTRPVDIWRTRVQQAEARAPEARARLDRQMATQRQLDDFARSVVREVVGR